jgi:hypothetical protein
MKNFLEKKLREKTKIFVNNLDGKPKMYKMYVPFLTLIFEVKSHIRGG